MYFPRSYSTRTFLNVNSFPLAKTLKRSLSLTNTLTHKHTLISLDSRLLLKELTKNVLKKASLIVLSEGGVVHRLRNMGEQKLAYPIRSHQEWFKDGRQWTMIFEAHSQLAETLRRELKLDPIVIRHGLVKMGSKLKDKTACLEKYVDRQPYFHALQKSK